jgi:hypothetical protein
VTCCEFDIDIDLDRLCAPHTRDLNPVPHGPEIGRYLAGLLAVFLVPDSSEKINVLVTIPSAIAELSMVGYQLAIGVRTPRPAARILAAA